MVLRFKRSDSFRVRRCVMVVIAPKQESKETPVVPNAPAKKKTAKK